MFAFGERCKTMKLKQHVLEEPPPPNVALRLSFAIDGTAFKLVQVDRVDMLLLASESLETNGFQAPFWFEVSDKAGFPLYRRALRHPLHPWVETRSDNPEQPLTYVRVDRLNDRFGLDIPDMPNAHALTLFGFPPAKEGGEADMQTPPKALAHFTLAQIRKRLHASGKEV